MIEKVADKINRKLFLKFKFVNYGDSEEETTPILKAYDCKYISVFDHPLNQEEFSSTLVTYYGCRSINDTAATIYDEYESS
jgi:hypothetical protein